MNESDKEDLKVGMDLNFWKYKENAIHDHAGIYQTACCDGQLMEELETLPIDDKFQFF